MHIMAYYYLPGTMGRRGRYSPATDILIGSFIRPLFPPFSSLPIPVWTWYLTFNYMYFVDSAALKHFALIFLLIRMQWIQDKDNKKLRFFGGRREENTHTYKYILWRKNCFTGLLLRGRRVCLSAVAKLLVAARPFGSGRGRWVAIEITCKTCPISILYLLSRRAFIQVSIH